MLEINGELRAENYSTFFREQLYPAHNHLLAAANLTDNDSLRTFLQSRAKAFLSNDYYKSDKDWMDLDSKGRSQSLNYFFYLVGVVRGQMESFKNPIIIIITFFLFFTLTPSLR